MQSNRNPIYLDEYLQRKLILLVDNDITLLFLLGGLLEDYRLRVILAESETEGWKMYCRDKPDVIVSGIAMTARDSGYKLLKRVRQSDRDQPFIFLSSQMSIPGKWEKAVQLGADACFDKPFEPETLFLIIDRLLKSGKGVGGLI